MALDPNINTLEKGKFREGNGGLPVVATTLEDNNTSLRFEEASSTILYLGTAEYGALDSQAKWKIQKIDLTSGVSIKNASNAFDQIWDDRASLTYV